MIDVEGSLIVRETNLIHTEDNLNVRETNLIDAETNLDRSGRKFWCFRNESRRSGSYCGRISNRSEDLCQIGFTLNLIPFKQLQSNNKKYKSFK